jgi:hypothetical protein
VCPLPPARPAARCSPLSEVFEESGVAIETAAVSPASFSAASGASSAPSVVPSSGGAGGGGADDEQRLPRFAASAPWPFPQSLMVGFVARAAGAARQPNGVDAASGLPNVPFDACEMDDVRWFGRAEVRAALAPERASPELHFPGRASLAYRLISEWAAGDD